MSKPTFSFRMSLEDINLVKKVCLDRGEDPSDFIRRSVRTELAKLGYLTEAEKKSLGIKEDS